MAPHAAAILDHWLSLLPAETPLHSLSGNDRQYKPVTPQRLRRWKAKPGFCTLKSSPEFIAADYSCELNMGSTHAQLTLAVQDRGLHAAAWDALVNLCAGLAARGIPIAKLTLE